MTTLLAYPNVSEGRDRRSIDQIAAAFGDHLLDVHSDPDHNRSAYTLAGEPGELAQAVAAGAARAMTLLSIDSHDGVHPRVGIVDVAAIVYLSDDDRGAACAEALVLADLLADTLELPVFLYGDPRRRPHPRATAPRGSGGARAPDRGGRARARLRAAAAAPQRRRDAGRRAAAAGRLQRRAPTTRDRCRRARYRRADPRRGRGGPEGRAGARSVARNCSRSRRCRPTSRTTGRRRCGTVVAAIARHARPAAAELVGLAPQAAFDGFPADLPLRGYQTIEDALARRANTA